MSEKVQNKVIVIFAESATDRDLYRNSILNSYGKVFCFEKEATCFDNLETIKPDIIVLKTESQQTLWRFIFAARWFKAHSIILVASSALNIDDFLDDRIGNFINSSIYSFAGVDDLLNKIVQYPQDSHEMNCQSGLPVPATVFLLGGNSRIKSIRKLMPTLINSNDPVLITGEAGVGKEHLVRQIVAGLGCESIFTKISCADLSTELILKNGHITDMISKGKELATNESHQIGNSLVIYLDGIDRLKDAVQSNLLSFLDETPKYMQKTTGHSLQNIRFVATADEALNNLVHRGGFRKELYYRLNVIPVSIPPLRERVEDIPLLVDHLVINACYKTRTSMITLSSDAIERLIHYDWPQNVKELITIIDRIVQTRDEYILVNEGLLPNISRKNDELLPYAIGMRAIPDSLEIKNSISKANNLALKNICQLFASRTEKKLMKKALEATNWNRKKAAELLNISYKSMLNKMKMYEIV